MLMLSENHRELHEEFLSGNFSVKQRNTSFSSVATDQALEQTINRSQKSTAGIIGSTHQKDYVAVWGLSYHHVHSITNVYREVTGYENENYELKVHHELSPGRIAATNEMVENIVHSFHTHENPFQSGPQPLRNVITQKVVDTESAEALLTVFEKGCEIYGKFCSDRFQKKDVTLTATISKVNLPSFSSTPKEVTNKIAKAHRSKEELNAQELIKLAMERDYDIATLLSYELTENNILFESPGIIRKETSKPTLIDELVKMFDEGTSEISQQQCIHQEDFCLIVDVIFHCRKIKLRQFKRFEDFAIAFCTSVQRSSDPGVKRIDFVFDCYFKNSPKSTERS